MSPIIAQPVQERDEKWGNNTHFWGLHNLANKDTTKFKDVKIQK